MNRKALIVILVAIALVLIAATIKSGWLYLVSSFLFALVIAGLLSGFRTTRKVRVERECPKEVFEGEPFPVKLRVRNSGRLTGHLVTIRDLQFSDRTRRAWKDDDSARSRTVTIEKLGRGSLVDVAYKISAPRRGVFEEAELDVNCGGVFGAADVRRKLRVPSPITVFPRVYPIDWFPFEPVATFSPAESYEWARKGIGQDYYGVREYVHGDPLRHIHWKASARQGRLIVREFQQEFRPSAGLVAVLRRPARGDRDSNSLEDGLRAAASITNYYAKMGSLPQLVVPGGDGFEVTEPGTFRECLLTLASYEPGGIESGGAEAHVTEGLADALSLARSSLPPGSAIAVVTNLPLQGMASALLAMGGLEELSLVLVLDDSYGRNWRWERSAGPLREFSRAAAGRVSSLYVVTRGREIGRCLSEPLSITAS